MAKLTALVILLLVTCALCGCQKSDPADGADTTTEAQAQAQSPEINE